MKKSVILIEMTEPMTKMTQTQFSIVKQSAGVACNMSSMQYYPEDIIAYALMSAGFVYAIVSARTLPRNAIVSARTRLHMQLCPPPCKTVLAVNKPPLVDGTRSPFFYKLGACHE